MLESGMTTDEYEVMQRAVDARRSELKRARDAMSEGVDEAQALAVALTWRRQVNALDAAWDATQCLIWADARAHSTVTADTPTVSSDGTS